MPSPAQEEAATRAEVHGYDMHAREVGIVYVPSLEPLLAHPGLIDVVEIEPQAFWLEGDGDGPGRYTLYEEGWRRVRALQVPKLLHGVAFPIGGARPPAADHLPLLRRCIADLDPEWVSEHLAFNRCWKDGAPRSTGFLLPPLQTAAGADAAARSIRAVASRLDRPYAVETGVNYLAPRAGELSDGAFVARVVEAADCGLVLDLHNLWANQQNGRQSIHACLADLPLDRVVEVHLAGGFELSGFWLDAHSGLASDALLDVLAEVAPYLGEARAVCLEVLDPFAARLGHDEVAAQLEQIRAIWDGPRGRRHVALAPLPAPPDPGIAPEAWEDALGALAIGEDPAGPLAEELARDPAIAILRRLIGQFRSGMVSDAMPLTTRLLLVALGDEAVLDLFARFWRARPPEMFATREAASWSAFLLACGLRVDYLADTIALDRAALEVQATGVEVIVPIAIHPTALIDALRRGEAPPGSHAGRFEARIEPDHSSP